MKYTALWLEDDSRDIPSFVRRVCDSLNVTLLFADTISTAVEIAQNHAIDLFLLDIEIADERTTGIDFACQLRFMQQYYRTPIVFVSSYAHLARHLFETIQYCRLLTKPYNEQALETMVGSALGFFDIIKKATNDVSLLIPVKRERTVEVDGKNICYIEFLKDNTVRIQFNHGECLTFHCQRSTRKYILDQIAQNNMSHLAQIYRSMVVNINEIKSVELNGHGGTVYLFGDTMGKPLGIRYRDNVKNFL